MQIDHAALLKSSSVIPVRSGLSRGLGKFGFSVWLYLLAGLFLCGLVFSFQGKNNKLVSEFSYVMTAEQLSQAKSIFQISGENLTMCMVASVPCW